jgi:phthalate 4,5-cis-dihydrodiol dehydrogenase
VVDELCAISHEGRMPQHGGAWSRATLEVCLALLQSQREGRDILMQHQVPTRA